MWRGVQNSFCCLLHFTFTEGKGVEMSYLEKNMKIVLKVFLYIFVNNKYVLLAHSKALPGECSIGCLKAIANVSYKCKCF